MKILLAYGLYHYGYYRYHYHGYGYSHGSRALFGVAILMVLVMLAASCRNRK